MNKALRWSYSLLALASFGCATAPHVDVSRSADAQFQHDSEYYLASDALEGRGPGTRGQLYAADYVAKQFKDAGLVPVPGHGYFQPWEYVRGWKIGDSTSLTVGDAKVPLDDGFRPNSLSGTGDFTGQAVFCGYGVNSTQYHYDDLADLDLKGKVAVVLRYEPRDASGHSRFTRSEEWSPEAQLNKKFLALQNRGAAAIVFVNPAGVEDSLQPYNTPFRRGLLRIPIVQLTRPEADKLFSTSALGGAIDASGKPASKPLGITVTGKVDLARNALAVRNVIGMIPGEGPHADEYVVVGSHYDHVGWGGPESLAGPVHAIHHGADDNASGTTAMMTLARRFAQSGKRPERTMLFMAFVCEEQGLLGSAYWCNHPTVPLDKIAYMLNLDMLGRMKNHTLVHGGETTSPTVFPQMLANAYGGEGLREKSMGGGGFGRSDHESFARKKIPVLFLFTGLHPDYHRPTDTADKINYPGLLAATDVAGKIASQMLTAPRTKYDGTHDDEEPDLGESDMFAKPTLRSAARPAREPVGLGLRPDETQHDYKGIHIEGVRKGMGAERAGIKEGDTLLELDHVRVDSVQDLQEVYDQHKPGDKVAAKLLRDGKTLELDVTFTSRTPGT